MNQCDDDQLIANEPAFQIFTISLNWSLILRTSEKHTMSPQGLDLLTTHEVTSVTNHRVTIFKACGFHSRQTDVAFRKMWVGNAKHKDRVTDEKTVYATQDLGGGRHCNFFFSIHSLRETLTDTSSPTRKTISTAHLPEPACIHRTDISIQTKCSRLIIYYNKDEHNICKMIKKDAQ